MYRPIDVRELRQRYATGERNFAGYTVKSGGDEFDGDFTGINLVNATLDEVYMERIIFINADLRSSVLTDRCLNAADLTNADLRGCDLRGATFCSANLTGADLRDAMFDNTDFRRANLTDANLSGVHLHAIFDEANLTRTNLRGAKISERLRSPSANVIFLNTIMPDGITRSSS
jgi:uncharacterized protein YjbI with pentapeptide repeats